MPSRAIKVSCGILPFRKRGSELQVFLAHPGGPFWANRDAGAWTICKGLMEEGESLLDAAKREFEEETGVAVDGELIPLGSVLQKAGKEVHAWAWEAEIDPSAIRSNTMRLEWPYRSGRWITVPEIDKCEWFSLDEARSRVNPAQAELLVRLEERTS